MTVTKLKPGRNTSGPPADLAQTEAALWRRLQTEFELTDAAAVVLLGLLCRNLQLSRECRERIEADGKVLQNGREHPLLKIQRDADKAAANALKAMQLDVEALRPGPGRPPGAPGVF